MNFSPQEFTFQDFQAATKIALAKFDFIEEFDCDEEDCIPWVNIEANRAIKPEEALEILESLQINIVDEILFHSLKGKRMRIVVNGKFHFTPAEKVGFDETYAHDFGKSIEKMKKKYKLN